MTRSRKPAEAPIRIPGRCLILILLVSAPPPAFPSDIFTAARENDAVGIREWLAQGADPNLRDEKGRTPVHAAAEKDAREAAHTLLEAGGLAILTDWRGATPLALAQDHKHDQMATILLNAIRAEAATPPPCELGRLRGDDAKGVQTRFLAGDPVRVREAVLDALQALGFVAEKKSLAAGVAALKHLSVRRNYPDLAGTGGAGGERALVDFRDTTEGGSAGVSVSVETKRSKLVRMLHRNWSMPVLDESACLLTLLGNQPIDRSAAPVKPSGESARAVVIPDGTRIHLRLYRFLNSAQVKEGTRLPFVVSDDVTKDGAILIARGSAGWGSITKLDKAALAMRDAKLQFQVNAARTVDGQEVRLRDTGQVAGKRSKAATAANVAFFRLPGLFMKGSEKGIRAGILMVGYVEGDVTVRLPAQ